jgi:hypothetical protein
LDRGKLVTVAVMRKVLLEGGGALLHMKCKKQKKRKRDRN